MTTGAWRFINKNRCRVQKGALLNLATKGLGLVFLVAKFKRPFLYPTSILLIKRLAPVLWLCFWCNDSRHVNNIKKNLSVITPIWPTSFNRLKNEKLFRSIYMAHLGKEHEFLVTDNKIIHRLCRERQSHFFYLILELFS